MSTARATAALHARERSQPRTLLTDAAISLATLVGLLGLALVLLLSPVYMHAALDAAGSAEILGVERAEAHALSDRTVGELLFGPGDFAFTGPDGGPFYGQEETAHMRDVRVVLYGFLAIVGLGGLTVVLALARAPRRAATFAAIARGGAALAVGVIVLGVVALVAFETAFELFHRIFFPAGNWAFDPASQRLVQLYPLAFWQISSAALGLLALLLGGLAWLVGRLVGRRMARLP